MILRFSLTLILSQNIQAHEIVNKMVRIIGGHKAEPRSWPSIVSLNFFKNQRYQHHCGGSILNRYQIITAAHCFGKGKGNPSDWIILVGKNNIRRKEIHQSKITRHKAMTLKNVYIPKKIILHER